MTSSAPDRSGRPGSRRRRDGGSARVVASVVVALVAVAVLVGVAVVVVTRGPDDSTDREAAVRAAAEAYLEAINRGSPGDGPTVQPGAEVTEDLTRTTEGLGGLVLDAGLVGEVTLDDTTAEVPVEVEWTVEGATWTSTGTLHLVVEDDVPESEDGSTWLVDHTVAGLDERLRPGDVLSVETTEPDRAAILDGAGQPLVAPTPVVHIGVVPSGVTDLAALVAELERLLGIDGTELAVRVRAAEPDQFVDVITLRRSDYDPIRDQVRPLPGTRFQEDQLLLGPSRDFARAVLGTVGPATAEQAAESDGRVVEGELVGQGGIQSRYDAELSGTPGLEVRVTRADPDAGPVTTTTADAPGGTPSTEAAEPDDPAVEVLETVDAQPGTPVRTTLDVRIQQAAEAAIADQAGVTSLVAVRASTSEVVAVANSPTGTSQNIGFTGRVAPGSTFKVVTTLALIRHGLTPDQVVPCPAESDVAGVTIRNAGGFELGDVPFRVDFARSCNTAFVELSTQLGSTDLHDSAAAFGLGVDHDPGLGAFAGSVPANDSPADTAAASIGQARNQASPLGMAMVAATVASGRWRAPVVVAEPAPPVPPEIPLGPGEAETLRDLMRGVVVDGSATAALAGVPGGEVFAKTGTAEFGTADPPETNAWIIGFQGDLAFCVFVEGGESGGGTAGPIAARFLTSLAGG